MSNNKPVDSIVQLCWKHSPDQKGYCIEVHPNYLSKSRDFYAGWCRWFVCQIGETLYYNYYWYEQRRHFDTMDMQEKKQFITQYHLGVYTRVCLGDWNR